jgi:hypothetical protein
MLFLFTGYSGIDTATMFGAGGGFSAFTQPTGYGFDFHTGTGSPSYFVKILVLIKKSF